MKIIASILIISLLILALLATKKILKIIAVSIAMLILLGSIFGIRTHLRVYNLNNDELDLRIRHVEVYNRHNAAKFISHLSFDKLKNKVQSQCKDAFVYEDRIYIVKDNAIYSIAKGEQVRRFGVKCNEYDIQINCLILKADGESIRKNYIDFPIALLTNLETKETKATFEDIAKFYKNFRNATISDNKIIITKGNQQHIISLNENKVVVEVKEK